MSMRKFADGDLSVITTYQAGVVQAAMHRLLQRKCDEFLAEHGISKMQWLIIGTVLDAGKKGIRISDLAEIMGTTISYLTTAINLLESKRMLKRTSDDDDSRAKIIVVHPRFATKCNKIERELRQFLRETIYREVAPEDFQVYIKVLYQLKDL